MPRKLVIRNNLFKDPIFRKNVFSTAVALIDYWLMSNAFDVVKALPIFSIKNYS